PIRWELGGIERRVVDPAAPTCIELNNPLPTGKVGVIPNSVLATAASRLDAEQRASASAVESTGATGFAARAVLSAVSIAAEPITAAARKAALDAVDKELVAEKLLAAVGGDVSDDAKKLFGWEREIALPTAGVIVKRCLDECDVCEPSLARKIELENELLKTQ